MKDEQGQVRYAGFAIRFLAYCIDFAILFVILLIIQLSMGQNPFAVFTATSVSELQQMQKSSSLLVTSLVGFVVVLAYYMIFYVNYDGATPGKRLVAVKVTRDDGSKVSYPVVFVRYIGSFVSAAIFCLGYLWIIWDKRKQGFHDKIAKTIVVRTEQKPKMALAIFLTVLAVFLYSIYISLTFMKIIMIGMKEGRNGATIGKSQVKYKKDMNPEAKVLYDKSMQLFKDMKAAQDDPQKVIQLNDENIAELKKATELDPENAEIWNQLGNAYTWQSSSGTLEDGLSAFRKAEELDPTNSIYVYSVGDMLYRLGKYDDSVLQYQKVFRLTDQNGYANLGIARSYVKLGITDTAKEHYQKSIEIFTKYNNDGSYDEMILRAQKELSSISK